MTSPDSSAASAPPPRSANKHRPRRWLPWCGAVLLGGLIVVGFLPQPTRVETARVVRGTLQVCVTEEGKTRLRQRYIVSAPVAGHLRRIPYKAGEAVQTDKTVLAVIDALPPLMLDARSRALAEARRAAAAASLDKARAAEQFAANELRRFQKLYAEKTVAVQELESVQLRATAAAQDVAAAESELQRAEAELAEFSTARPDGTNSRSAPVEVRSPVTGRVLRVFEENARVVNAGVPLIEVGDPTDLEVVIEVLSRDGAVVSPGTRVELEQWGGGAPLLAKVRLVEPAAFTKVSALGVEEQRVNVVADLVTPPEQRPGLGDQFRVEARLVVWEGNDVLKVPAGALFRRGERWATLVVANGRARERLVTVGKASDREMQVLAGLNEGEEVILHPGERVRDGQRVRPIQIAP